MGWSIPLGRIAGIRVRAHWTVLLLIPIAMIGLAGSVFPAWYPGRSTGAYAAMAAAGTVLLLVAILLHELGHALQARALGIRVEGVTLWFLGGLTRFCGAVGRARDDLRVAAAGPLVTCALAAIGGIAAVLLRPAPAAQGVAAWFAAINALLAAFNLLPAFPLDGGRILRALLWMRSDDHVGATRGAAHAGRAVGAGFVGLAVVLCLWGALADGLWLAFVAWFVLRAAGAEEGLAEVERALGDRPVAALMRADVPALDADEPIAAMLATALRAQPVTEAGLLTGLALRRRAQEAVAAGAGALRAGTAALPRGGFAEVAPADPVGLVLEALVGSPQVAVVVEDDRPVGILFLEDVERRLRGVPERRRPPPRRPAHPPAEGVRPGSDAAHHRPGRPPARTARDG